MFLCPISTSKIHDCKIIAWSLVPIVSTFDKVIAELRKTQIKNSIVLWCLTSGQLGLGYSFGSDC